MLNVQLKAAGSNILFAAATEISDSILKGAETSGFNGMVLIIIDLHVSEVVNFLIYIVLLIFRSVDSTKVYLN